MGLTNRDLAELLSHAGGDAETSDQKRRALRRAARAALLWPEEAADLLTSGRSLTELRYVGPWLAGRIAGWIADPPDIPSPPPLRHAFGTFAAARARLVAAPEWTQIRGDLQVHTRDSDGTASVSEMASAAAARGYEYLAITDHSQGLKIANGMDEERLARQGEEIARVNDELAAGGHALRVLRAIEMNLSPSGDGDMDPAALAGLDLVLGAFHSRLRVTEDQTERYVAALRNPTVHVLAHPRGRIYDFRAGLRADWKRVFAVAAQEDRALEIDAYPDRQDLDIELLVLARDAGIRISIGSDAHAPHQLEAITLGVAAALEAGIPRERILNFMDRDALHDWARGVGRRAGDSRRQRRRVTGTRSSDWDSSDRAV